jgi:hypothetical protein
MSGALKFTRQAGGIALIGAVIGLGVSVLLNAAYSLTPAGADLRIPPWQPALDQIAAPALTFAPGVEVYHLYGRFVFLVTAFFIVGLFGLIANLRAVSAEKPPRLLVWGYRLAMTGLILNLFGNLVDYWMSIGETVDFVAFVGGTFLGLILQAIGLIMLGISGLRSASMPKPAAWALILWFPFSLILLLVGMENLPAAPLLALSLAWVIIGGSMVWLGLEENSLQKQTI